MTGILSVVSYGTRDREMFKKGFLTVLFVFACSSTPTLLMAEDSASSVNETVTWWEKYGKYWDSAVADSGADESIAVALNDE